MREYHPHFWWLYKKWLLKVIFHKPLVIWAALFKNIFMCLRHSTMAIPFYTQIMFCHRPSIVVPLVSFPFFCSRCFSPFCCQVCHPFQRQMPCPIYFVNVVLYHKPCQFGWANVTNVRTQPYYSVTMDFQQVISFENSLFRFFVVRMKSGSWSFLIVQLQKAPCYSSHKYASHAT